MRAQLVVFGLHRRALEHVRGDLRPHVGGFVNPAVIAESARDADDLAHSFGMTNRQVHVGTGAHAVPDDVRGLRLQLIEQRSELRNGESASRRIPGATVEPIFPEDRRFHPRIPNVVRLHVEFERHYRSPYEFE